MQSATMIFENLHSYQLVVKLGPSFIKASPRASEPTTFSILSTNALGKIFSSKMLLPWTWLIINLSDCTIVLEFYVHRIYEHAFLCIWASVEYTSIAKGLHWRRGILLLFGVNMLQFEISCWLSPSRLFLMIHTAASSFRNPSPQCLPWPPSFNRNIS